MGVLRAGVVVDHHPAVEAVVEEAVAHLAVVGVEVPQEAVPVVAQEEALPAGQATRSHQ